MESGLLKKLFGDRLSWHGSCVILVDAETSVKTTGPDSIIAGGMKSYSPRVTSGRVVADTVCYHPEHNALLTIQRVKAKQHTGEDILQQSLIVIDVAHVVGVEFESLNHLASLGLSEPPLPDKPHYAAGTLVG
jgi:hypothetical protein